MAVNEQASCLGRVAAESQNGFDVSFLRQQNVWIRLDRIVKAQGSRESVDRTPGTPPGPAIQGQGSIRRE